MSHLDDLLAGIDITLTDDILARIDEILPPGTDIGTLDQAYVPCPPPHRPSSPSTRATRRSVGSRS